MANKALTIEGLAHLTDTIKALVARVEAAEERIRPRIIREGFARTGMMSQYAYKAKWVVTDKVNAAGRLMSCPAIIISGVRQRKTGTAYNRDITGKEISLERAFPGGMFEGRKITSDDFLTTESVDISYDEESNVLTINKYSFLNAHVFLLLRGAKLKGKYLTVDASGKVISVDATACHREVLKPLDESELTLRISELICVDFRIKTETCKWYAVCSYRMAGTWRKKAA